MNSVDSVTWPVVTAAAAAAAAAVDAGEEAAADPAGSKLAVDNTEGASGIFAAADEDDVSNK